MAVMVSWIQIVAAEREKWSYAELRGDAHGLDIGVEARRELSQWLP